MGYPKGAVGPRGSAPNAANHIARIARAARNRPGSSTTRIFRAVTGHLGGVQGSWTSPEKVDT
jgi:hypothetical protein